MSRREELIDLAELDQVDVDDLKTPSRKRVRFKDVRLKVRSVKKDNFAYKKYVDSKKDRLVFK